MFIACMVIGVACVAYGASVGALRSGTSFHLVWFALGACFIILGLAWRSGLIARLPKAAKFALAALAVAGVVFLGVTSTIVLSHAQDQGEPGADYVVVLGAQVKRDGTPTDVLRYRLEAARAYLLQNPKTVCIVSGGQGPNEPITEAECMMTWLVAHDIDRERVIEEDRSETTVENIRFSRQLMEGESPSIVVATNDFHVFRAMRIAEKQGIENVSGLAGYSTPFYKVNNVLREDLGLTRDFLVGDL